MPLSRNKVKTVAMSALNLGAPLLSLGPADSGPIGEREQMLRLEIKGWEGGVFFSLLTYPTLYFNCSQPNAGKCWNIWTNDLFWISWGLTMCSYCSLQRTHDIWCPQCFNFFFVLCSSRWTEHSRPGDSAMRRPAMSKLMLSGYHRKDVRVILCTAEFIAESG